MKFAFIIMGNFDAEVDHTAIREGKARIIGVANLDEACIAARKLYQEGIDCIELCGAFGEAGTRKVIEATDHKVPVGYVVHLPEQDHLYEELFKK